MKPRNLTLLLLTALTYVFCTTPVKTADNSQNSLDWQGTYRGVLPCADCSGILTKIILNKDNTYSLQRKYLGKDDEMFSTSGNFTWSKDGSTITISNEQNWPSQYKVGENRIQQLDMQGNPVSGALASAYVLTKITEGISNKYWKLIELNGKAIVPFENGKREPHMILHTDGNRISGNTGCNSFSGTYDLKEPNRISFAPMAVTKMFCTTGMETETQLLKVFQTTDSYYVSGDSLQLIRARMAPLARFVAVYLK